jgi:hypothetical protein
LLLPDPPPATCDIFRCYNCLPQYTAYAAAARAAVTYTWPITATATTALTTPAPAPTTPPTSAQSTTAPFSRHHNRRQICAILQQQSRIQLAFPAVVSSHQLVEPGSKLLRIMNAIELRQLGE